MKIQRESRGPWTVLAVTGRVDAQNAPTLSHTADAAIQDAATRLALDFTGVNYLSSAGIRVLLRIQEAIGASGGAMALVNPQPFVKEVLDIANFTRLFTIVTGLNDLD